MVASSPFAGPSRLRRSLARSRETHFTRSNRRACSQANQGWENGAFWIFRGFVLDLGGMGVNYLFHFILSKIEVHTFAILEISKARAPKVSRVAL